MDKHYHHIKIHKHELEEETDEQKKKRKLLKTIFSIFLALVFLSFVIPYDVLNSLIESKTLNENSIVGKDYNVFFKPEVLDELQIYYKANQLAEFKLCLIGFTKENNYYVTGFYEPKILFKTPISIHSEICNSSTVIDLHSHPFRNCIFSQQDIFSYQRLEGVLGGVMCDVDRFNFYKN